MKLSIIIAAYNVEAYIKKCVLSCVAQNLDSALYEIIVVNDGSTDNTLGILNKLKVEIPNLKAINQLNAGLGASRNCGIAHSNGDYIWLVDGDDFIKKNVLAGIVKKLTEHNLDVLVLNYNVTNANYQVLEENVHQIVNVKGIVTGAEFYYNNYQLSYSWLFIFKKEKFLLNDIKFMHNINMQDSEILPKLMLCIARLYFYNTSCYNYVQHENSFTNSNNPNKRYFYFQSIVAVRKSLLEFAIIANNQQNKLLYKGILKKVTSLNLVIFNHLVFFKYTYKNLKKIITLLKHNKLYPVKTKVKGKMKIVLLGINTLPFITNKIINLIRKN